MCGGNPDRTSGIDSAHFRDKHKQQATQNFPVVREHYLPDNVKVTNRTNAAAKN